mmetsp:Transcript_21200/g.44509  ORF Transcript_21200/g.44509 Transcript_21200/m.44509 type:complete len:272 (-) Transcript_21200:101-916(-)|eukprot:CAMPEP_0171344698 /NCGR_PEP_ID=MMETSP0878-20121228/19968_1 /TAXON_ID=67004 /ORGANISM="Thalassiosira weissflogii, Strain CCMP1336" /LENGTH=271 /DNA_ID=CAMNT_0011847947 /DNA_START=88 /DNA_END=903 /DNA_ORIENTATION=+
MKWKELIPGSAWEVQDLLTKEECAHFLQCGKRLGIQDKTAAGDVRHRNSTTVSLDDKDMADRIFERIKGRIPQEISIDEHFQNPGLITNNDELYGKWKPYGLNFRWRLVCYPGRGHFGPHRDGFYQVDEHHRSFITINGFLTDRPPGFGGATRFVKDDIPAVLNDDGIFSTAESDVLHRVEAERAGTASVFFHDLMHDGEPLKEGSPPKWLFRTEIMYERDPESAPKVTAAQIDAKKCLALAEEAESRGEIGEAIFLYNRAYRLNPRLENQ